MNLFSGVFKVEVWNEIKTKMALFHKDISIPFQPHKGMEIHIDDMAFTVINLSWNANSGKFDIICAEVESWYGDSYFDLNFYKKRLIKKGWEYAGQTQSEWHWGDSLS